MVIEYSKNLIERPDRKFRMFYQGGTAAELEINTWRGISEGSYVTTDLSFALWWSVQQSRHKKMWPVTFAFGLNIDTDIKLLSHCKDTDVIDGLLLFNKRQFFTI